MKPTSPRSSTSSMPPSMARLKQQRQPEQMAKPPVSQLGQNTPLPASPEEAELERVPAPHQGEDYLVRFTAPEFTSICPVTGQPDFAHLVIDYVPKKWIVESKSLKLYLGSYRNHGAFHEDCTVRIGLDLKKLLAAQMAAHRRLLVSARRHSHRRVLADRRTSQGTVAAGPGRAYLSRAWLNCRPTRVSGGVARQSVTSRRHEQHLNQAQHGTCRVGHGRRLVDCLGRVVLYRRHRRTRASATDHRRVPRRPCCRWLVGLLYCDRHSHALKRQGLGGLCRHGNSEQRNPVQPDCLGTDRNRVRPGFHPQRHHALLWRTCRQCADQR
jgi:7-cyano-7-deazaguanine reductase